MASAKKVTSTNHLPATGDGRFPVYSKQFNELVDVVNDLSGADGTLQADTISEETSGTGVTVDGVLLKDNKVTASGGISQGTANVTEFTVLTTLTATEIVGTAAGDIGHANGATLVAAPTSDYALEFVSAVIVYDFATAAYTGGANDLVICYGSGGAALSDVSNTADLLGAAGDKVLFQPASLSTGSGVPMPVGTGLSLRGTAYTNPGTAAGVLRVYTTYRIITTGL